MTLKISFLAIFHPSAGLMILLDSLIDEWWYQTWARIRWKDVFTWVESSPKKTFFIWEYRIPVKVDRLGSDPLEEPDLTPEIKLDPDQTRTRFGSDVVKIVILISSMFYIKYIYNIYIYNIYIYLRMFCSILTI